MFKKIAALACVLAIAVPAQALNVCNPSPYVIFHINGVNTTAGQAQDNVELLEELVGKSYRGKRLQVRVAYNDTKGLLLDVRETVLQKMKEFPSIGFEEFVTLFVHYSNNQSQLSGTYYQMWEEVRNFLVARITTATVRAAHEADLKRIVNYLRGEIVGGMSALLVPHSQGNLYANSAYVALTTGNNPVPPDSIAIAGVASPASFVAGAGRHATSSNDLVMAAVRKLYPHTLQANHVIDTSRLDVLGHSFSSIYLNPFVEGRAIVLRDIMKQLAALRTPDVTPEAYAFTVRLTHEHREGTLPLVAPHLVRPDGKKHFGVSERGEWVEDGGLYRFECSTITSAAMKNGEWAARLLEGGYVLRAFTDFGPGPYYAKVTFTSNGRSFTKEVSGRTQNDVDIGTLFIDTDPRGYPVLKFK